MFRNRLKYIPPDEMERASGTIWATVRKSGGGLRRKKLASWVGVASLEEFFKEASAAWRALPKEGGSRPWVVTSEKGQDE
ncbi:MAG: hypothetical protein JKY56_22550 [Kofleriaceae bacterium]|nr:hypothetical protein [Kofleriaceae bacterium]